MTLLDQTPRGIERFVYVSADDAIAEPLLRELEQEYDARYGEFFGEKASAEITRYPAAAFSPEEGGAFVLLLRDGVAIAGGAYKRFDDQTAELKRIWTSSAHRRQGLARRVVKELEDEAVRRGYTRAYLTTGPRQPEAKHLYFQTGYTPLFDTTLDPEEVVVHGFAKSLDDTPLDVAGITTAHNDSLAVRSLSPSKRDAPTGKAEPFDKLRERAVKVVPARHWWRWVLSALVAFVVLQFVWSLVTNKQYEWNVFAEYFFSQSVLNSLGVTLGLTVVSVIGGFILGAVLANFRLSKSPLLSGAAYAYIWFFRSVPLLVQILVWYNLGYLYPTLGLGTPFTTDFWLVSFSTTTLITAFAAATIGLTLHQAAYFAEIIRGGILSVDQGQLEASAALGLPRRVRFFRIILPQAARAILPNFFNEVIGLVKGTSVVFVVALPELFYTVQVIYNRNQRVIPLLLVAVVWYAIITTVLSIIQFYVERHYARGAHRELPPTPIQRATAWVKQQWARLGDETTDDPLAAEKNRRHDIVLGSGS
ncbi:polar amino acid transport system permease protein [Agreia bicolorata]|uniref:Polar amino acid transport system permease protein n=1 Tax=Agreia bicolorata TaxID=110935 RepID=A0A1T4X0C6_9MICO|nr:polar amino acid transport system permease protein [Agreia bicolorata]